MLKISVRSNVKEFTRGLTRIQKKQVPFATARALTWTAQDVQKAIIDRISRAFNVTKKWWLKQQPTGIKIRPAKKTSLSARVYTSAHFAKLQEEGGKKKPHSGQGILIPTSNAPKYARKSGGHKKVFAHKKTLTKGKSGSPFFRMKSGYVGVFQRKGKKRLPIKSIYTVEKTARIQPRFEFKRTAIKTVRARFKRNFKRSLSKALDTARK